MSLIKCRKPCNYKHFRASRRTPKTNPDASPKRQARGSNPPVGARSNAESLCFQGPSAFFVFVQSYSADNAFTKIDHNSDFTSFDAHVKE